MDKEVEELFSQVHLSLIHPEGKVSLFCDEVAIPPSSPPSYSYLSFVQESGLSPSSSSLLSSSSGGVAGGQGIQVCLIIFN